MISWNMVVDGSQAVVGLLSLGVASWAIFILPWLQRRKSHLDLLYKYLSALHHQKSFCQGAISLLSDMKNIQDAVMQSNGDLFTWDDFYALHALLLHYKKAEKARNVVANVESEYLFRCLVLIVEMINATIADYHDFASRNMNRYDGKQHFLPDDVKIRAKYEVFEKKFDALKADALRVSGKIDKEFDEVSDALIAFMRKEFRGCRDLKPIN